MILIRILEGEEYIHGMNGDIVFCQNYCTFGKKHGSGAMWTEKIDFAQLFQDEKGGILIAEDIETGKLLGWVSFVAKETARELALLLNKDNRDMNRLIGRCIQVGPESRGKGIGTALAVELLEIAKEWSYNGVEVVCRKVDHTGSEPMESIPGPYRSAGFVQVENSFDELASSAELISLEYVF